MLQRIGKAGGTDDSPAVFFKVRLVSVPKPALTSVVTLVSEGSVVGIQKESSNGVLPITITPPAAGFPSGDTLALSVTGAPVLNVVSVAGTQMTLGKNGYALTQTGGYLISLTDLVPGSVVTVSVQAIKSDGKTPDGDPATATYTAIPLTVAHP